MRSTGDPGPADGPPLRRELGRERSELLAATQDLVQKLTDLADRYDAMPVALQPARGWDREPSIALMRSVAASGSRLIGLWASPDQEQPEPALAIKVDQDESVSAREAAASQRDDAAERRDQRASLRDRRARENGADLDPGFADRFLAATDRGAAAGDRAAAIEDRSQARRDLDLTSAPTPAMQEHPDSRQLMEQLTARATFHQAQGLLMARGGMTASEAFEALLRDAQQRGTSMTEVAMRLVQEAGSALAAPQLREGGTAP